MVLPVSSRLEVLGSEFGTDDAVGEHVPQGSGDRSGNGEDRFLGPRLATMRRNRACR